mmetsp:Transcript_45516/g.61767  ORF Transcript_45516/g.61767 Transcript_45516/m.61767 type:complete len:127 (+) Transcript_45516:30-410(+)
MECNVCLNEWNSETCIPRMLNCGHSFCELCLEGLFKPSQKSISCATCLQNHELESKEAIGQLVKNFTLISLVETTSKPAAKEYKPKQVIQSRKQLFSLDQHASSDVRSEDGQVDSEESKNSISSDH